MPKLVPERVSKMTVTGKPEFQRNLGDIAGAVSEPLERGTKSKLREVPVHRDARLLLKYSRQVKRRGMYCTRYVVECEALTHFCGEIRLGRFRALCMIRISPDLLWLTGDATLNKRGFQHVSD